MFFCGKACSTRGLNFLTVLQILLAVEMPDEAGTPRIQLLNGQRDHI